MTKFLGVFSAKGGVGKTTSTIALGASLNYFGKDITLVDANLTAPNIGLHLGVPKVPISLHDVLRRKNNITEATYMHPSGLKVVPASISLDDLKNVDPERLQRIVADLNGKTDLVILDTAAGLGATTLAALNAVHDVIVVTTPELPSVTDALKTIKLAEKMHKNVIGAIITRAGNNFDMSVNNIKALLDKPILAVIPEDKAVRAALLKKDSVVHTHPKSNAAIAYKKLASSLIGKTYKEKPEGKGFWHELFRMFGLK